MAIIHINNKDEFNEKVRDAGKLVIVDFWAPWCGPCRMIGPIFEELSNEIEDVVFAKINVDEAQELAAQFNIMSIPTLMIFKEGEVIDQQMGAVSKDMLKHFIDKNLDLHTE
jgi:thioredoxin 1